MHLKQLIKSIDVDSVVNDSDLFITGIAYNSQYVTEGNLFVCIKGYKTDGHKYLEDAVKKGAKAAIVLEPNRDLEIPQYVVKDSRIALAKLSAMFYDYPSEKLNVIGVTATSGKTTTTYMLNAIFEQHQLKTGLIGSVVLKIGDKYSEAQLTTPDSLELQQYFKEMYENDITHVMMEVSSAALELERVNAVDFDIVSLNNVHREHIDMHGTYEKYVEAKTKLIKEAKQHTIAILSLDNDYSEDLMKQTEAEVITFSVNHEQANFSIRNLGISSSGTKFVVVLDNEIHVQNKTILPQEIEIEIPIPGLHIASNAMVAIIISLLNEIPVHAIQEALLKFEGVERRFELIHKEGPIIVDDHCSNPGNIDVTFEAIEAMEYADLRVVYAVRGQRGKAINRENAVAISKWIKKLNVKQLVVTNSVGYVTENDFVDDEEAKVVMEALKTEGVNAILIDDLSEAIEYGMEDVQSDDLVLLSGCQGMDAGHSIAKKILDLAKVKN